jgi:hypothetical protein
MDRVLANLHEEVFRCRKEGESTAARLKLSKSALMTCTKKLKIVSKEKARLEQENTQLRCENRALSEVARSRAQEITGATRELEAAKRQIAELQEQVLDRERTNALLLDRILSTERSHESVRSQLTDSQRLLQQLMRKLKKVSGHCLRTAGAFSFLCKEHSGDYAQLCGLDSGEIQESMSRLFRMLITPVSQVFHAKLFGISEDWSRDANDALSSLRPASKFLYDTCDKNSPMWNSLRRALMDHWRLNHWDLMQLPTHTQIQLVSIYFENKIQQLEAGAGAGAGAGVAVVPRAPYASMFSLDRPGTPTTTPLAATPGTPLAMRILNRLELLAARHGSPWTLEARIIFPNDAPVIADKSAMGFLELNGVRAFHSPAGGYVFRFFTIPSNQRKPFASEGFTLKQLTKAGFLESTATWEAGKVDDPCMHTGDLIDALRASMGPDFTMVDLAKFPGHIASSHLMRLCFQFVLTTPHIAVFRLVTTFRQYMMEKHQAMVLNFGMGELLKMVSEFRSPVKDEDLACARDDLPKIEIPSINLPARVVRIPPVFKMQLISRRIQTLGPPVTKLAKALGLSRCIHIRAYINYHNEANVGSMDDMDAWVDMMNTAEGVQGEDPGRLPRFKFGYARTTCLGFHIHAFVMCPSPLRDAISISGLAADTCHLVELTIGKQLNMVVPADEAERELVAMLYDEGKASAVHIFLEDVVEGVRRAVQSDYLIFFGDHNAT